MTDRREERRGRRRRRQRPTLLEHGPRRGAGPSGRRIGQHAVGEREEPGVDLIRERREQQRSGDEGERLFLRIVRRAELHRSRQVHRDDDVQLALGVGVAHVRRVEARRDVPVDTPHVVAGPVRQMLVEIEARAAQRARVRADAEVADLLRGVELDVAQLAHDVLGDHGIRTALSRSCRIASASTFSACARMLRAIRCRAASQKISLTSPGST